MTKASLMRRHHPTKGWSRWGPLQRLRNSLCSSSAGIRFRNSARIEDVFCLQHNVLYGPTDRRGLSPHVRRTGHGRRLRASGGPGSGAVEGAVATWDTCARIDDGASGPCRTWKGRSRSSPSPERASAGASRAASHAEGMKLALAGAGACAECRQPVRKPPPRRLFRGTGGGGRDRRRCVRRCVHHPNGRNGGKRARQDPRSSSSGAAAGRCHNR